LIEAMIVGLPFIASDIKPIKEIIPEELFKWLVKPEDIDTACELLLNLKNELESKPGVKIWNNSTIKDNFNATKRFGEFLTEIAG
jgi:glycosyltransferase involved in cell wall biosynthesis